jgi:hypothetical protein
VFTSDKLELHEKPWSLRREVVAHTDYERKKRLSGSMTGFTTNGALFDLLEPSIDVAPFGKMCEVLQARCFRLALELNQEILQMEAAGSEGHADT